MGKTSLATAHQVQVRAVTNSASAVKRRLAVLLFGMLAAAGLAGCWAAAAASVLAAAFPLAGWFLEAAAASGWAALAVWAVDVL